jgi:hypothetical protein
MTEHTKLPWREEPNGWTPWQGAIGILPADQDEEHAIAWTTSGDNEEANAAYIVKACNAFPDLVKALQQIADGTTDEFYPFRAMGHDQMKQVARDALRALVKGAPDHG